MNMVKDLEEINRIYESKLLKEKDEAEIYLEWGKEIYKSIDDVSKNKVRNYKSKLKKSSTSYKDIYDREIIVNKIPSGSEEVLLVLAKYREALKKFEKAESFDKNLTEAKKMLTMVKNDFESLERNLKPSPQEKEPPASVKNPDGKITVFCPICNAPMILREGPYGKFWGCTTYSEFKCPGKRGEYFV